jgi:hypothetical protein
MKSITREKHAEIRSTIALHSARSRAFGLAMNVDKWKPLCRGPPDRQLFFREASSSFLTFFDFRKYAYHPALNKAT